MMVEDIAVSANVMDTLFTIQSKQAQCSEIQESSTEHKIIVLDRLAHLFERAVHDEHFMIFLNAVKSFIQEAHLSQIRSSLKSLARNVGFSNLLKHPSTQINA